MMRYPGGASGKGVLLCAGREVARAAYDFDSFCSEPAGITGSGEIRLSAATLRDVFGRNDVQLRTDDGRLMDLRFSEKLLLSASSVAHVDVTRTWSNAPPAWQH